MELKYVGIKFKQAAFMTSNDNIWDQYVKGKLHIDETEMLKEKKVNKSAKVLLDLHHHTETKAFGMLQATIEKAYLEQISEIIIITGINLKANQKTGILCQQVPRWLEYTEIATYVKSYSYLKNNEGALSIKLKRLKT